MIDSWEVVERFEARMAEYCGAPFAVATDTCTAALHLCFHRAKVLNRMGGYPFIAKMPAHTYLGVACAARSAGFSKLELDGRQWRGFYGIELSSPCDRLCDGPRLVFDSACRLFRGMYRSGNCCLSFQYRKHLKIGRGGMILTDSAEDATWFRKARFCGRAEPNGVPEFVGFHCFMEPERAARGLVLMDSLPDKNEDLCFSYPDLREYSVLR